jgi:hypothetical protein
LKIKNSIPKTAKLRKTNNELENNNNKQILRKDIIIDNLFKKKFHNSQQINIKHYKNNSDSFYPKVIYLDKMTDNQKDKNHTKESIKKNLFFIQNKKHFKKSNIAISRPLSMNQYNSCGYNIQMNKNITPSCLYSYDEQKKNKTYRKVNIKKNIVNDDFAFIKNHFIKNNDIVYKSDRNRSYNLTSPNHNCKKEIIMNNKKLRTRIVMEELERIHFIPEIIKKKQKDKFNFNNFFNKINNDVIKQSLIDSVSKEESTNILHTEPISERVIDSKEIFKSRKIIFSRLQYINK